MTQEEFIRDVLKIWDMAECKPLLTPGEPAPVELPDEYEEEGIEPSDVTRAQKMAGSLIWLSTRTRPDIAYAQSRISSMATKAPRQAVLEGLRVLRYLAGTAALGLRFQKCSMDLIAYTDANFSEARSQSGTVVRLGTNTVAWRSAKQAKSVLSTAESEAYACACTTNIADYVKELRESLCLPTPMMMIKCDNKAAIVLATGEGSWKTKGAANKVYYLRELVALKLAKVEFVATNEQAADSLTKFLRNGSQQSKARELLGVEDVNLGRMSPQVCGVASDRITVSKLVVRTPGCLEKMRIFPSAANFGSNLAV